MGGGFVPAFLPAMLDRFEICWYEIAKIRVMSHGMYDFGYYDSMFLMIIGKLCSDCQFPYDDIYLDTFSLSELFKNYTKVSRGKTLN